MKSPKITTSTYIVIDSKVNKDGLSKLYIRILQGKKKKDYFTGIRWPKEKFDKINEQLLPRFANDADVDMQNSKILEYKNRINKLSIEAYYKNVHFGIDDYVNVLEKKSSLTDFAAFMEDQINRETKKSIISYETYQKHIVILKKIKEYLGPQIPMVIITLEKIQEFDAYYRKEGFKNNTVSSYHKVFSKYIGQAVNKSYMEKNPYDDYKYSFTPGERVALTQIEVKKLYKVFEDQVLDYIDHEVLRRFLFSCITGIRISDTHQVTDENIKANALKFTPYKTKKLNKQITIPLPGAALKLIEGRKGKLFVKFADQSINRILKRIAIKVGVNANISYHSARDTFGTIFIELGGDIKSLCDLMGHSSTKITEIYLKMADKRKIQLMNNFDTMFS